MHYIYVKIILLMNTAKSTSASRMHYIYQDYTHHLQNFAESLSTCTLAWHVFDANKLSYKKEYKYNNTKSNTIITEYFEIMFFDIAYQKLNCKNRDEKCSKTSY